MWYAEVVFVICRNDTVMILLNEEARWIEWTHHSLLLLPVSHVVPTSVQNLIPTNTG